MRILFSIITCALLACCAIQSPQAGPVGFRLSSGFKPSQIPGLQLWLDASQIVGLNDGDAVATWSDLSGNANNATQGTASARPTYQTGEINGQAVVQFDGTDDYLSLPSINANTVGTVFIVGKKLGASSVFLGLQSFASGTGPSLPFYFSSNSYLYIQRGGTGDYVGASGQNATLQSAFLYAGKIDGATLSQRVNRTDLGVATSGAVACNNGFDALGGRIAAGVWGNQMVAEVLFYNSALSAADIVRVETYLTAKWGTP